MSESADPVLKFPCRFPIKMMGRDTPEFHTAAMSVIQRHAGKPEPGDVRKTPSRNGKFVSITVTIDATSKEQLDAIYRDISAHQDIMVAL